MAVAVVVVELEDDIVVVVSRLDEHHPKQNSERVAVDGSPVLEVDSDKMDLVGLR